MKQGFIQLRLRAAMLLVLMCLTMTSWATVYGTYDSSTKCLNFEGSGEITRDIVEGIEGYEEATNVNFASGVTSIGYHALSYLPNLEYAYIPYTITSLDYGAFRGCTNLNLIIFGSGTSTLSVGAHAFEEVGTALEFRCYRPFSYTQTTRDFDWYFECDRGIFYDFDRLTKVVIGANVKTIPEYSFNRASNLATVDLSNASDLTTIGAYAFEFTNIDAVEIPASVTEIKTRAFYTSSLQYAFIHNSDASIYSDAFESTTQKIYASTYEEFLNSYTDKSSVTELLIPTDDVANHGFTASSNLGDLFPNVQKVTFSSIVKYIGSNIFSGSTSLQSVVIGGEVTTLPSSAFEGCTKLTDLTINSATIANPYSDYSSVDNLADIFPYLKTLTYGLSVTSVSPYSFYVGSGENYPLTTITFKGTPEIENYAFYYNKNLSTINGNVGNIGDGAFYGCSSLGGIKMSSSATTIGENAFNGCTSFANFEMSPALTSIDKTAFTGCTKLTDLTINSASIANPSTAYTDADNLADRFPYLKTLTYSSDLTSVSEYSFYVGSSESYSLTTVTFNGTMEIGNYAFYYNKKLSTINGNVGNIGDYSFSYCNALKDIPLSSSTTTIGVQTFYGCESLQSVVLPSSLTALGNRAFMYCIALKSIVIPENLTSLNQTVFSACPSLTDVTINSKSIASATYTADANLTDVFPHLTNLTLGDEVTTVSNHCFEYDGTGTSPLASVTFNGTPSIGQYAFAKNRSLSTITGSVKSVAEYSFYNCVNLKSITITDDAALGQSAFYNCTSLEDVTLPSNLTYIYASVFYNCTSLNNVVIPENVTSITGTAFSGCTALTHLTINSNTIVSKTYAVNANIGTMFPYVTDLTLGKEVTSIGYCAFYQCTSLEKITLPSSLETISAAAFQRCLSLNNVVLPASVTTIKEQAFYGCTALKQLTCLNLNPVELTTDMNVFFDVTDCELDVLQDAMELYRNAEVWKDFYFFPVEGFHVVDGEEYTQEETTIDYPAIIYSRTFATANIWYALYLPFSIDVTNYTNQFDVAEIWTVCPTSDTDGDGDIDANDDCKMVVNILKTGYTVANRPYLIRPKAARTYHIEAYDATLYQAEECSVTCSTTQNEYVIKGLYSPLDIEANDGNYFMGTKGGVSYLAEGTATIKPNRWVMNIKSSSSSTNNQAKFIVVAVGEDMDESTAIRYVNGDYDASTSNDAIYNMNGMKMNNNGKLPQGIYIQNGKKLIIK